MIGSRRSRSATASTVFVELLRPPPLLVAVGATDLAEALCRLEQAGVADDTAVVVLSHDETLVVPALAWALGSEAFYVGVLGSRRRQAKLRERLEEAGVDDSDRVTGPAGLDPGAAHSVEETALSILAEIVAVRGGRPPPDAEAAIHS